MRLTLSAMLVAAAILSCACEAQYPPRLRRPEHFDNAQQISDYIKQLQGYYSVHGRGRYGKRDLPPDASVMYREFPLFFETPTGDDSPWRKLEYN